MKTYQVMPVLNLESLVQHVNQFIAAQEWTRQAEKALTFELLSALASGAPAVVDTLRKVHKVQKILRLINPYLPENERDSKWLMLPSTSTLESWRISLNAGKLPHKIKALPSSNPAQDFAALLESFAKKSPAHSDFAAIVKDAMRKEYTFNF